MAYPPLTRDSDLAPYPGAPFADSVVRAAEASIRRDANWHITPVVTESMVVTCKDRFRLVLKTLRIVSVTSVVGDDLIAVTGFKIGEGSTLLPPDGQWWTLGRQYTVTLAHGYDSADDLLPVVASRCLRQVTNPTITQQSETMGQRTSSQSYNTGRVTEGLSATSSSVITRYTIFPVG